MGIDVGTPSQLAPSVGTIAAGSTVSAASSEGNNSPISSANNKSPARIQDQKSPSQAAPEGSSNRMTKEATTASPTKDMPESTADFIPHPPEFQETFAELETGLDLVVGSFNFHVNNLGMQDMTGPKEKITATTEIASATPGTTSPSIIATSFSSATTMSTQELNKWLDSLGDEEIESTRAKNQVSPGTLVDNPFEYGISLDDFTGPEVQMGSEESLQVGDSDSLSRKSYHNPSDVEMSTNDKIVENQHLPEGPVDCQTNSDMSLDEDNEQAMEIESALEYPQSIPRQVCVLFAEGSGSAAMRRPAEFPCTVTMPDGVTQLIITAQMAEKADKAITECTMMPPNSTRSEERRVGKEC